MLFNMLSRLVIAFLPRSKRLLISQLHSPSAVILEPKKLRSVTVFIVPYLFAMKILTSGPITSWEIDGETVDTVSAMKLKDAYSLKGKL